MTDKIFVTAVVAVADQPNEFGEVMSMKVMRRFVEENPGKYWIEGNKLFVRLEVPGEVLKVFDTRPESIGSSRGKPTITGYFKERLLNSFLEAEKTFPEGVVVIRIEKLDDLAANVFIGIADTKTNKILLELERVTIHFGDTIYIKDIHKLFQINVLNCGSWGDD